VSGPTPVRAAVLGSGSWGTTFGMVLTDAGCEVRLWGRDEAIAREVALERRNTKYLPGVELPTMFATTDAAQALIGTNLVVVAVPSQVARTTLERLRRHVEPDAVVVSLMKGVELSTDERFRRRVASGTEQALPEWGHSIHIELDGLEPGGDLVGEPPDVARYRTDNYSNNHRDRDDQTCDTQRNSSARHDSAQYIPSQVVGAEPMFTGWGMETVRSFRRDWIVWREGVTEY
jgi:glycerol-3-phosphate dehydrogenase (NAD(P)+)